MRELFDNGWVAVLLFCLAALGLGLLHERRGPWRDASTVVPGTGVALRYRVRPAMFVWQNPSSRLVLIKAGGQAQELARGADLEAPLALFLPAGDPRPSTLRLRGPRLDLAFDTSGRKVAADFEQENFVGSFVLRGESPAFEAAQTVSLRSEFARGGAASPAWASQARPQATPVPSPTAQPTPRAQAQALLEWKRDAAFLEGLLGQHAPGLFSAHRVPDLDDRRGLWRDSPRPDGSPRFLAGGDFNGDRKKDYAFILPARDGGFGLFALLSTPGSDYAIIRLSQGEGLPQRYAVDRLAPGIYRSSETPGQAQADPAGGGVVLETDSLRFSRTGLWSSILFWQAGEGRFRDLAEKE